MAKFVKFLLIYVHLQIFKKPLFGGSVRREPGMKSGVFFEKGQIGFLGDKF
jgi:hypothetical protein